MWYKMKSIEAIVCDNNSILTKRLDLNTTWKQFKQKLKNKELYLFGCGNTCKEFLNKYGKTYEIAGILDNDSKKWGTKFLCYDIMECNGQIQNKQERVVILITSSLFFDEIRMQLKNQGYENVYSVLEIELNTYKVPYKLKKSFHYWLGQDGVFWNGLVYELCGLFRSKNPAYHTLGMMKDTYKGQTCFIVATGPSLNSEDVELLHKKRVFCFGVNKVIDLYENTEWRPDVYVLYDRNVAEKIFNKESVKNVIDFADKYICIEKSVVRKYMANIQSDKLVSLPVSFLNHKVNANSRRLKYKKNVLKGIYCTWTVTIMAMVLAVYMGFEKIVLLGVDCNYSEKKQHFDGSKTIPGCDAERLQRKMLEGFQFIKDKMEKQGIDIVNATRGGQLETFKRESLETILLGENV